MFYTMMKIRVRLFQVATALLFVTFFSIHGGVMAQGDKNPVTVYSFDEFEYWLHKDTDSLYVINFWATWCAPCVKEIPHFEKIYDTYKDQKVKVVFVSLDHPGQIESRVLPFMERLDMQARVLLLDDPNSNRWIPKVSDKWTGSIPATVIYNRDFRAFYEREFNYEELEEIILPLL